MAVGIVRNKLFAVLLGTFGLGVLSQLMNFYLFVILLSSIGIPLGLTKYVSEWGSEGSWVEMRLIISQANSLLLIVSIFVILLTIIFGKYFSYLLFSDESFYLLIIYLSFSIPFSLFNALFDSFIKGLKRFGSYLKLSVIVSIISLLITIFLVYFYGVFGSVLAIILSSTVSLIFYLIYFKKNKLFVINEFFSLNFNYSDKFRFLIKLAFAYLLIGSMELLTQLILRAIIIKNLDIPSNGIYQSIYSLSMSYFSILFISLGTYLLPTLSAINDKNQANIEINNTLKLTFMIIVPLISLFFVFRYFVILMLFSNEFLSSVSLLFFAFTGDYFKAFSGVIGTWLVPASKIKLWIYISIIYFFSYLIMAFVFLNYLNLGLKGILLSYLISNFLNACTNLYVIVKYNNFSFSKINKFLFPLSFFIILILMVISEINVKYGYAIILPVLLIWFKLSLKKDDINAFFSLIQIKIKQRKN